MPAGSSIQPVIDQIITYAPMAFRHRQHCDAALEGTGIGQPMQREAAPSSLWGDLGGESQDRVQLLPAWLEGIGNRSVDDPPGGFP